MPVSRSVHRFTFDIWRCRSSSSASEPGRWISRILSTNAFTFRSNNAGDCVGRVGDQAVGDIGQIGTLRIREVLGVVVQRIEMRPVTTPSASAVSNSGNVAHT
jgi:hypothetical protein